MNFLTPRKSLRPRGALLISLGTVGVFGAIDFATGPQITMAIIYLIPIFIATWYGQASFGYFIAVISAVSWFFNEKVAGHNYLTNPWLMTLNIGMKAGMYFTTAYTLARLKAALMNAEAAARTDYLTQALNRRAFFDGLQAEIHRAQRFARPFSIIYFDVDDFKQINDSFGHEAGDMVLRTISTLVKQHSRPFDMVARMGGDEFAMILPETGRDAALAVVAKLQDGVLTELDCMGYKLTLSLGVVTCLEPLVKSDEIMRVADRLMYAAKSEGGGTAKHQLIGAAACVA